MIDSLLRVVDTVIIKQNENYDLLNKVNNFYDSAWSKLIIVGTASFAVVGIIVPLIIQWYQKKILIASEKNIIDKMQNRFKEENENNKKLMEDLFLQKIQTFNAEIKRIEAASIAQTFHLQAIMSTGQKKYSAGYISGINAARKYFLAKDDLNLKNVLEGILKCLPDLSKEELTKIKYGGDDLEKLLDELKISNNNNILAKTIRLLRIAFLEKMNVEVSK